jgi:hypothetical protein
MAQLRIIERLRGTLKKPGIVKDAGDRVARRQFAKVRLDIGEVNILAGLWRPNLRLDQHLLIVRALVRHHARRRIVNDANIDANRNARTVRDLRIPFDRVIPPVRANPR